MKTAMNLLQSILQPAVRIRSRYSVRPFYVSILVFAFVATISWALKGNAHAEVAPPTAASLLLAKRDIEGEVIP